MFYAAVFTYSLTFYLTPTLVSPAFTVASLKRKVSRSLKLRVAFVLSGFHRIVPSFFWFGVNRNYGYYSVRLLSHGTVPMPSVFGFWKLKLELNFVKL